MAIDHHTMPHVIGLVSRTGQPQLQHPARQAERQRIGHDRHLLPEPVNGMQVVQSGTNLYRSRFILDKETSEKVTFPVRGRNIAGNHHAPFAGDRHGVALIKRAERRDTHRRNGHIGRMRFRRVEPVIIASLKATRQGQQPRSCCQTQQTEPSAGSKPDMETTISHQNR